MLSSHGPLTCAELDFLRARLATVQSYCSGAEIKDAPGQVHMVLSGWVAWQAPFVDGRRQIIALALPGDVLEQPLVPNVELSHSATGPASTVDATDLVEALAAAPPDLAGLSAAWNAARTAAAGRWVCQMLRLGRMSAYERTAGFMLELHERLRRAGLADERSMPLPLTQEMLSDFLGLSVVHVNRMLQQLRRDTLIVYRAGRVTFPDLEALARAAGRG